MLWSAGQRLGAFVIEKVNDERDGIARCVARDTATGARVILTAIAPGAPRGDAVVETARRAAGLADARVRAPLAIGEQGDARFVASPLTLGRTLRAAIGDSGATDARRAGWLRDVAATLAMAHARGVVHGALAPEHIVITDDRIAIGGWGTTRAFAVDDDYAPPEVVAGAPPDARSDQFAWGAMVRALVAETALEPTLEGTIARATSPAPSARYASMNDASAALATTSGSIVPTTSDSARTEAFVIEPNGASPAAPERVRSTPRGRAARGVVPAAVLAIALGTIAIVAPSTTPAPRPPPKPFAASPTKGTESPRAAALFGAAMQAMRDASLAQARATLDDALLADPNFAAAHLRHALLSLPVDEEAIRAHFARATSLRASLDAHDARLLRAFEPAIGEPARPELAVARMHEATRDHPSDADYAFHLGLAQFLARDLRASISTMERAVALDPSFAVAVRWKAFALMVLGDAEGARDAFDACLRISPAATSCLRNVAELDERIGRCDDVVQLSRRTIAIDPTYARAYYDLALALAASDQDEAAEVALKQYLARLPGAERAAEGAAVEAQLASFRGDFAGAARALERREAALAASADEWEHFALLDTRLELDFELERRGDAASAARDFLARRAAWLALGDGTASLGGGTTTMLVDGALYRAGAIPRDDLARRRRGWRATLAGDASAAQSDDWIWSYANAIVDGVDAREAIDALPSYPALMPISYRNPVEVDGVLGRAYLLAGDPEPAIAALERAVGSCLSLDSPILYMRAVALLAGAREARGERDAACALYGRVLHRWRGTPSSTARHAEASARALRCTAP